MRLSELQERCGGTLRGQDVAFASISTDSRTFQEGDAYLALSGDRFDGHDFAEELAGDAKAIIVEKSIATQTPQLIVADSRYALGQVGAYCREHFEGPVVAITGSSGKTTARNMVTAVLATQGDVCATLANYNNEIGVPLTLLTLDASHASAVLELGARHVGDIAYLGQFVKPTVAVLLNAGSAHIGEFGGYDNIVAAKGEIYAALDDGGIAVVNLDDKANEIWRSGLSSKDVLTYSVDDQHADVYASAIALYQDHSTFNVHTAKGLAKVSLTAPGQHNVSNALAAVCVGLALDISIENIALGLSNYKGEAGRLTKRVLSRNVTIIDDSYNANLASMKSAVDVLTLAEKKTIAVLGEMGELGDLAEAMHKELAEYLKASSVDECWLIGSYALAMADVIGTKARCFLAKQEIADALLECNDESTVLLKASRFVALEEIIEMYQRGLS